MFTIGKDFTFSASHQLDHLPDGHQCRRLHGHNYVVTVEVSATMLNEHAMVIDFGDLDFVNQEINANWDHRHLNDFLEKPTSERIAEWFSRFVSSKLRDTDQSAWRLSVAITVRETQRTFARFKWESPE